MAMVWVAIHLNLRQKMRPVRETVRLLSHFVNGLPKFNPSTASARCNLSSASAPGHVTGVPELNLSPAGVPKANPSRASAPHDIWKVNRHCTTCKATAHAPPGVHWDRCPECWAKYVSHERRFKQITAEVEQEEDEGGTVIETFTDYRPSRLSIGLLHSDPIVETSSLSAVTPPEPKYNLKIEGLLGRSKALSCLQIETLVYASQRHLQHLQNGTRAGFLIGDGAGVGKGRTVAGLIWENWCNSRVKALWISAGSDLKFDARRDLDDVGAECIKVHALNKLSYSKLDSESVGVRDGVIFLTYRSLAATSDKGSRLEQLVEWCGPGYDGLIIFDECHKAKNLISEGSKKPNKTGKAVLELQEQLPGARVVYCSATGASEPRNMAYMVRLGLWGGGTCFRDFTDFSSALAAGGVGALELVAMEMKARGMYLCRSLSYKGAEFEVVEAPLNITMMETYKAAVDLWVALREELLRCPSQSKSLWRSYWSTHQQFFRLMCMSAKVPTVVRLTKQALEEGKAVVIGLQSTGEARTEDAVAKYGSELDDFISGPRELLLKFVEEQKLLKDPAHIQYTIFMLEDCEFGHHNFLKKKFGYHNEGMNELLQCVFGQLAHPAFLNPHVIPARTGKCSCYSCERKPNEHRKLLEGKSSFIDKINSLDLPRNPLDDIKDQLGGPDKVAEITGRRSMLVRNSSGAGVSYRARNASNVKKDMVNMHEKQQFMDGNKLIAIISEAGSAGVSLQADRRAANQRRRVQITLELPWSADRAIQQFGRTHRSNQASAPQYRLLITNLGGERRFAATVAKRLESLGALTQGDRRAGPSLSAYNYVSKYGKKALRKVYEAILEKATFPVSPPGCSFQNPDSIKDYIARARTALVSVGVITEPPHGEPEGSISYADMGNVERFLNRLLGMPPEIQNSIFELFVTTLEHEIQNARLEGTFDKGIIGCKAKSIKLQGPPKIVYVDHTSGASAKLHTFKVDRGVAWETVFALLAEKQSNGSNSPYNGFYESEIGLMGRRHILLAYESSTSGMYKTVRPYLEMAREIPLEELQKKYTKITNLERAQTGWEKEHTISSKQCMHGPKCRDAESCPVGRSVVEVFVLGGVILPLWSIVKKTLAKRVVKRNRRLKVMHIETTDGSLRVAGFHIPHTAVTSLLEDLKLEAMDEQY